MPSLEMLGNRITHFAVRDARAGLASVSKALSQCVINEPEHWFMNGHDAPGVSAVELLLAFDEHLFGYQDRHAVLDDGRAESIYPGGNGVFRSTLVVKGRVAGLWKKKEAAKKLTIEVMPYESLNQTASRSTEPCPPNEVLIK